MSIEIKQVADMVQDYFLELKKSSITKNSLPYFADELGEIRQGELHIIAGTRGTGYTSFLLRQALYTAANEGVLFFSLDVPKNELVKRIISQESRVALSQISNNMELKSIQSYLNNKPLYIAENNCLNIFELQNTIQEFIKSNDVKLVVIDSFQGIGINPNNWKDKEILVIMKTLKQLAVDLNIALLLSTQINKNDGNKPSKKDLGYFSIQEFADKILLIHRPEYYAIEEFEDGSDTKGKAEIIICDNKQVTKEKNVILNYDKKCLLFYI
jgi:replicative DNA helicase